MEERPKVIRSESMTGKPLSIDYATPSKPRDDEFELLYFGRRILFAIGGGLLTFGVGDGFAFRRGSAPEFMGWGATIAALVMPWGWHRSRRTED